MLMRRTRASTRSPSTLVLTSTALCVFLLAAGSDPCPAQDPEEVARELEVWFAGAGAEEVALFAPAHHSGAEETFQDALRRREQGDPWQGSILDAREQVAAAVLTAARVRTVVEVALGPRRQARALELDDRGRELLAAAEEMLRQAAALAEDGETGLAGVRAEEAAERYTEVLLLAETEPPRDYVAHARSELERMREVIPPEDFERNLQTLERTAELIERYGATGLAAEQLFKLVVEGLDWQTISAPPAPDLVVELRDDPFGHLKGIHPWPPLTGQPTFLSVVVTNRGLQAVDSAFNLELSVDGTLEKTWTFTPVQGEEDPQNQLNPILPGGTRLFDHQIRFASGGSHTLRWHVDAQNSIAEGDETNNVLETTVAWQGAPDLVVEDIAPTGPIAGGQKSSWTVTVRNLGSGPAAPFTTSLWPQGIAGGAQEIFSTQSPLSAGQAVTFPTTQRFRSSGTLTLRATVDPGNFVTEAEPGGESNNQLVKTFNLQPVDLAVSNLVISAQEPSSCYPFTLSFAVTNLGAGDAMQPFAVRVFPGSVSGGLLTPSFLVVNRLDAGQTVSLQHTVSVPPGNLQFAVDADYSQPTTGSVYFEPDRNNNVVVKTVQVSGPYKGLSYCLGESLYADPSSAADRARDADSDTLKDDLENRLADAFRPYFKFDSDEKARRGFEPVTLFQVRPKGCAGGACPGKTEVWVQWVFLFLWDGGYGPEAAPEFSNQHKGDNDEARYKLESFDGGSTWKLADMTIGGGSHPFQWPQGYAKPAYLGKRVIPTLKKPKVEWYDQHHPTIYMSAHKHHMYFDTAYDHLTSFYTQWGLDEDVNGNGAAFLSNLHTAFGDQRFNNVGEPGHHPAGVFVNCMSQFPATTIGNPRGRPLIDVGDPECAQKEYSAWGTSDFYEVGPNADKWMTGP